MADRRRRTGKGNQWDQSSFNHSDKNYVPGHRMGNPWNNTNNPNWRNQVMEDGFRSEMLNDPQRVEDKHSTEDNNSNKELLNKND